MWYLKCSGTRNLILRMYEITRLFRTYVYRKENMTNLEDKLVNLTLDDGQVLNGVVRNLTHHELISFANHFRTSNKSLFRQIMVYQHKKFIANCPPEAA